MTATILLQLRRAGVGAVRHLLRLRRLRGREVGRLRPRFASRDFSFNVARRRMTTTDSAMVWQVAIDLALATGDRRLRAMIAQVAAGVVEPSFSGRQRLRLWVRSAAQRALNRSTRQ